MLLKKNKIRIFALQNIDKYIHNMLNKEIFKEKNFYLQNLEKIKNLDFLKYYNISYKECEYLLDRKNKDNCLFIIHIPFFSSISIISSK